MRNTERCSWWALLFVAGALLPGCGGDDGAADAEDVGDVDPDVVPDADDTLDVTDAEAEVEADATGTGTVQGYVILQGRADHSGVSVVIDGTSLTDDSDSTGFWSIAAVPPDTYTVTASLAGFGTATSSPFEVRAGETTTVPTLTLVEGRGSLSGVALLADATEHAGITVSVEGTSYVAMTAGSGAWSITDVPVGNYAVRARYAGYDDAVASDQDVRAGLNTTVPTLTLRVTTSSIGGTVTLEGATDHSGVTVAATATWNPAITRSGSSNAAGVYTIPGVEPGMWNVTASKTNYVTGTRENVYVAATTPTVGVDFTLAADPSGRSAEVVYVSGGSNGGDPDQIGVVYNALAEPFVVEVRDVHGAPVVGAQVFFQVVEAMTDGHMLNPATFILTDSSGRASDTYVLGRIVGRNHVRAGATGVPGVFVNFYATSEPDVPATVVAVSGDGQRAGYGRTLAAPLVAEVRDRFGNPVRDGHAVTWSSTTGGTVVPNPSMTDAVGRTTVTATLGSAPGPTSQTFTAAIGTASVTFSATATPHAIDYLLPGRTWPGCPVDILVEVLGVGFDTDAVVIWNAGGTEQTLVPTSRTTSRLVVTLPAALFTDPARSVPVTVQQTSGGRCAPVDFVLGGVLPDTGQTLCYDNDTTITCPAPGATFCGQDAQFGWDRHVTPAQRFQRTEPAANQPVVFDRITQLEWQGCAAGLSGTDCTTGTVSPMNRDAAVAYCNGLIWGGHSDWYLPDVNQLSGIVDAGRGWPESATINPTAFPSTPRDWFWSSSSYSDSSDREWLVCFNIGNVDIWDRTYSFNARCIRRGPWTPGRFDPLTLSGDRVVRDTSTGRMWQGCAAGQSGDSCATGSATTMSWQAALAYCDGLSWGGSDDWRLPDRNELQSIVDYGRGSPSIDPTAFPGTPYNYFWSSSSSYWGSFSNAWRVYFNFGNVSNCDKSYSNNVRCIRRGP